MGHALRSHSHPTTTCQVKVVLPPKDDVLAPGVFGEGDPGPRWFDFSNAPDVEGFNSSACAADITWAGPRAFHMQECEIRGTRERKGSPYKIYFCCCIRFAAKFYRIARRITDSLEQCHKGWLSRQRGEYVHVPSAACMAKPRWYTSKGTIFVARARFVSERVDSENQNHPVDVLSCVLYGRPCA